MKVYITRDWTTKDYELWNTKPTGWDEKDGHYQKDPNSQQMLLCVRFNNFLSGDIDGILEGISFKKAKKMFNLPRHLKKKEIVEGTMNFKVKVK